MAFRFTPLFLPSLQHHTPLPPLPPSPTLFLLSPPLLSPSFYLFKQKYKGTLSARVAELKALNFTEPDLKSVNTEFHSLLECYSVKPEFVLNDEREKYFLAKIREVDPKFLVPKDMDRVSRFSEVFKHMFSYQKNRFHCFHSTGVWLKKKRTGSKGATGLPLLFQPGPVTYYNLIGQIRALKSYLHEGILREAEQDFREILDVREKKISETQEISKKKEIELRQTQETLQRRNEELRVSTDALQGRGEELKETQETIQRREKELKETQETLQRKEKELKETQETLQRKEEELNETQEILQKREEELNEIQETLQRKEEELNETQETLFGREEALVLLGEELREIQSELDRHQHDRTIFFADYPESLLDPWILSEMLNSGNFSEKQVEKIARKNSLSLLRLQPMPIKRQECLEITDEILGKGGFGVVRRGKLLLHLLLSSPLLCPFASCSSLHLLSTVSFGTDVLSPSSLTSSFPLLPSFPPSLRPCFPPSLSFPSSLLPSFPQTKL
jgi:hypothetical protein